MRFLARWVIVVIIIYFAAHEFYLLINEVISAQKRWQQAQGNYGQLLASYPPLYAGREVQRYLGAQGHVSLKGAKKNIEFAALRYALYPIRIAEGQDFVVNLEAKRNGLQEGNRTVFLTEGISLSTRNNAVLSPRWNLPPVLTFGQTTVWISFFFGLEMLIGLLVLGNLGIRMTGQGFLWVCLTAFFFGQATLAFSTWVMLLAGGELTIKSFFLGVFGMTLLLGIRSLRRVIVSPKADPCFPIGPSPVKPEVWFLRCVLLIVVGLIFLLTVITPVTDWDAMSKWIMKAKVIYHHRQLVFDYTHQNYYPLLWPVAVAFHFVLLGGMFDQVVPWLSGFLFAGFVVQLARGLVLVGVHDFYRLIILIAFILLALYLPVSDNRVFTNFVCANAENLFLCLMTCSLVMALQWMKFPANPGCWSGCLISVLTLSLIKLEGAMVAVIILAGLWFWARGEMTTSQKSALFVTGLAALLFPTAWIAWMKSHGYDMTLDHLGSPVTWSKISLILQMTGHIFLTTKLIFILCVFFVVAALWPTVERKKEDGFLLFVSVGLFLFAMGGTLSWSTEWIVEMYREGFNRLFLHAAPAMLFYCASRIVLSNKKGTGNG